MLSSLILVLVRFLSVAMCGICHAPEHAYDEINDHPEINRSRLCPDARERLVMASTPKPTEPNTLQAWDETTHTWKAYRVSGPCQACQAPTWRHAHETSALMLRRQCAPKHVTLSTAPLYYHGTPATAEPLGTAKRPLPRQGPLPKGWLTFNDGEVRSTRDFEGIPGPRAYAPRTGIYPPSGPAIPRNLSLFSAPAPWE